VEHIMSNTDPRRLLRKPEIRHRFGVGQSKLEEDILPRLDKVYLGPRCVAYTEASVDRLYDQLIAESGRAVKFTPAPNRPKPAHKTTAAKRRSHA
jgi:predicted DNA-binding transcriptional regulator AlpA